MPGTRSALCMDRSAGLWGGEGVGIPAPSDLNHSRMSPARSGGQIGNGNFPEPQKSAKP